MVDAIRNKLSALRDTRKKLDDDAARIDAKKAIVAAQIAVLEEVLQLSDRPPVAEASSNGHEELEQHLHEIEDDATSAGLTDTVLDVLRKSSTSLLPAQVADIAVPRIRTKSSNPRRVIQNTLINLRNRGKVEQLPDGSYRHVAETSLDDI